MSQLWKNTKELRNRLIVQILLVNWSANLINMRIPIRSFWHKLKSMKINFRNQRKNLTLKPTSLNVSKMIMNSNFQDQKRTLIWIKICSNKIKNCNKKIEIYKDRLVPKNLLQIEAKNNLIGVLKTKGKSIKPNWTEKIRILRI